MGQLEQKQTFKTNNYENDIINIILRASVSI